MITKNIYEFLEEFDAATLLEHGVLRGKATRQLKGTSIDPLIALMRESGVKKLEYPDNSWYIDLNGNFSNPRSAEITEGNIKDLKLQGTIFSSQNKDINPYYHSPENEKSIPEPLVEAEKVSLRLEAQLQAFLREHLEDIEKGLHAIDNGTERTVATGRIDITARDSNGSLVVIELKAGQAKDSALTQLLGYMSAIAEEEGCNVKGYLIAENFTDRLKLAAKAVDSIQLKCYAFSFYFTNP